MKRNKYMKEKFVFDLVNTLMKNKDYDSIKKLGFLIQDEDISVRKSFLVITKGIKEHIGEIREIIWESYKKDMEDLGRKVY